MTEFRAAGSLTALEHKEKIAAIVSALLHWFATNARDLPWRRTRDPYAIHVSEIMLQQTQVKTVIPFWNRWMTELPDLAAAAQAHPDKIHKLWEGLGYYTRVRNLQKAAQAIVAQHGGTFPQEFDAVLALPGIGPYTAGAICSIAFNQPVPILDGNVIRVLTRLYGITENPKDKAANTRLWQLAQQLVTVAAVYDRRSGADRTCSHLNQSLMELGALVCTPRNAQCLLCPVRPHCIAYRDGLVEQLPNLGKREAATARKFIALVMERHGKFFVRQRPAGVVNAHLWEFPNQETTGDDTDSRIIARHFWGVEPAQLSPLLTVKHSITRYRITLEALHVSLKKTPMKMEGAWKTPAEMQALAFTSAHKKLASAAAKSILSDR